MLFQYPQWIQELTSGEDDRSESAAQKLAALGAAAIPDLTTLLEDSNPDIRWWVVRVLGSLRHPTAAGMLCQVLNDPDPTVRQCAAAGLFQQPTQQAIPTLIAMLSDSDQLTARLAGNALTAAGKPAVPALMELLQDTSNKGRVEAARALATIKDERAIPVFFKLIKDGDSSMVEYWADIGLQNLGVGMAFFLPG